VSAAAVDGIYRRFLRAKSDQDYRTFFLAVSPPAGGGAAASARSMVIVVDYDCTKCKGIATKLRNRASRYPPRRVQDARSFRKLAFSELSAKTASGGLLDLRGKTFAGEFRQGESGQSGEINSDNRSVLIAYFLSVGDDSQSKIHQRSEIEARCGIQPGFYRYISGPVAILAACCVAEQRRFITSRQCDVSRRKSGG